MKRMEETVDKKEGYWMSEDLYCIDRKNPNETEIRLFLLEVNCRCPKCGKSFTIIKGKKDYKNYEIAHIYPNSPSNIEKSLLAGLERLGENSESFDNKIALCKDCHGKFDLHKTNDEYIWFLNKKKELLRMTALTNGADILGLESEIELIIHKIASSTQAELTPLNYRGIKLTRKIEDKEILLRLKIENYVVNYFNYIKNVFDNLDIEGKLNFDVIASEVKTCFIKCKSIGCSQSEIYNAIVAWVKAKAASSSYESCEALVAFFVQNCEVFNEISE